VNALLHPIRVRQLIRRSLRIARGPRFQDTDSRTEIKNPAPASSEPAHRRFAPRPALRCPKTRTAYDNTLAQAIREFRQAFAER
jgi:hypothetical protein